MFAVYKKELKSYFHSVIGGLFMAVLLFFIGLYFTVYCLSYGSPYFAFVLNSVVIIFLFTVPILTMRILAEERRQKTDQLLFTSPVGLGRIILGKYLALVTILALVILIAGIYPLVLSISGAVPFGETYFALFGFFLFGGACISIGVLISSLTESQVIAAVLTFAALLIGFMMSGISSIISSTGNIVTKFLSAFDIAIRYDNMMNGIVDVNAMLYYLSIIVVCLFLTYQVIQKRRWSVVNYGLRKTMQSAGFTVLVIVAAGAVNLAANYLPESMKSVDITDNKLYSITDTTKGVLDTLDRDVTIYLLSGKESADLTINNLLSDYKGYSKHIKVEYKDQGSFPNFASTYTSDPLPANSLIVESGDRHTAISYEDCFAKEVDYSNYTEAITGFDGEGRITSAISYVLNDNLPKVYAITGHEELDLTENVLKSIQKENMEVETINLLNYDAIPEDAESVIISGPVVDYSPEDADKVKAYLAGGGHAVILAGMTETKLPNFASILSEYGVSIVEGAVFEENKSKFTQYPFYVLPEISYHDITQALYESKRYIVLPQAAGFQVADEASMPQGVTAETLLSSSDTSYSKTNVQTMESYDKQEGDIAGPFVMGVSIEKTNGDGSLTKIVAFSCEYLLNDQFDAMVSGANTQLFTNALTNMADREVSISVPVKNYRYDGIMVSRTTLIVFGLCTTLLVPLFILAFSMVVWAHRRKR